MILYIGMATIPWTILSLKKGWFFLKIPLNILTNLSKASPNSGLSLTTYNLNVILGAVLLVSFTIHI